MLSLMMPVDADYLLATIVDSEGTMVDHVLEAAFLHLVALAGHPWPLTRLQGVLDLRGSPRDYSLVLRGGDTHTAAPVILAGLLPRAALNRCAILQNVHTGGLTALHAIVLVVIEHAEQA